MNHPSPRLPRLNNMQQLGPKVRIFRSAQALLQVRPLWESILKERPHRFSKRFDLNLRAAQMSAGREEFFIVCAEIFGGAAFVPAVICRESGLLRLLGEELFDYRCFLHQSDVEILR